MDIKEQQRLFLAVLVSIGFMAFLLMRVEWDHFAAIAARAEMGLLMIAFLMYGFSNFVRAYRFHTLDYLDKKLMNWWNINAFYNFITSTLPGGAGEAATVYVLKRFSMLDMLGALRILLLSRLMDLSAISVLFFTSALMIGGTTPYRGTASWISGALLLASLVALVPASERFVFRVVKKIPGKSAIKRMLCEKLDRLQKISEEYRGNNSYAITLIQSTVMMISGILSIHVALVSFGVDFTLVQSFYCYGVYAVFQIIPVQGIAGLGTQAAWWALALRAAGYTTPDAIAMGFVIYGVFYFFVAFIGLLSLILWFMGRKSTNT